MNKSKILVFILAFSVVFGFGGMALTSSGAPDPMVRKIVVFESGVNEPARDALMNNFNGVVVKDLPLIDGKAVLLPPRAASTLAKQAGVLRVDDDVIVEALGSLGKGGANGNKPAPIQPSEVLPWGIDRVNADSAWATTTGGSIKVAVVDTGIDLAHPDLAANIAGGYNAINPTKSANDDNGHGTHVAGIIGAIDNTIGVVGVGPQIDLYAVKVLSRSGSGWLSDIIEGLDWAIANNMQVVNMSLGTSSDVQSFHDAVIRVNTAGIVVVAAAGNSGGSVIYPAAYDEVIAVSATDSSDNIASFSSRGLEVDLAAPGVSIYSTYKGKTYATLSGTSMASPHVAGAAALVLTRPVGVSDADGDGVWDPAEVQARLEATAKPLGDSGKDPLYGSGLVDALLAVTYSATQP